MISPPSFSPIRTFLAGLAGGLALNASLWLTFGLVGFGPEGEGILLNPAWQSKKRIAVWTTLEPLPIIVSRPSLIFLGLMGFGVVHAVVYRWVSASWPKGLLPRAWRFAFLLFFLSYLFWEFFTPVNQFGEPLGLVGLELLFWAVVAFSEALAIAFVSDH